MYSVVKEEKQDKIITKKGQLSTSRKTAQIGSIQLLTSPCILKKAELVTNNVGNGNEHVQQQLDHTEPETRGQHRTPRLYI